MKTSNLPRPFPADYTYKMAPDGRSLHIVDLNLGNKSVTNDIENVLADIKQTNDLRGVTITYLDSMKDVDEIVHDNGHFIAFRPGVPD